MAFIHTIPEDQAETDVKEMYEENRAEFGYLPNYVQLFSLRPQVMAAWGQFLGTVSREMDVRRYELVTLAAARALHSTYCMLAHGSVMLQKLGSPQNGGKSSWKKPNLSDNRTQEEVHEDTIVTECSQANHPRCGTGSERQGRTND